MFKTLSAIATVAMLAATPAYAEGQSWQVGNDSFHIYYSDLDMNSTAGRAMLLKRVERAADRLCRDRNDRRECRADTIASAARVKAPLQMALRERGAVQVAAR